jgi:aminoglycoside phosphotransferase (APT) family kinase protein
MADTKKYPTNSPQALLALIHDNFPDLRWQDYRVNNEGWDHEVVILDNEVVFRFPNDDDYRDALRTEIDVLKLLKPLSSVAIPDYTYIPKTVAFAGYPMIPGEVLSKKAFDSLSELDRLDIAKQLAGLLSTMHTLIRNGYDVSAVPLSYVKEDQQAIKQLAAQHFGAVLSVSERDTVQKILADVDALLTRQLPEVLIHGDVYSNHLLWDSKTNVLGLIDFSDMTRGDPAIDFAELYEYGSSFVRAVYDQYTGLKDDTFLERAWQYQRWVGVYMMSDYFVYHKTSFEVARQTFDRHRF